MQNFRKILCPVDFSEFSELALKYAAALAYENDSRLVVFHAIPDLAQTLNFLEGNYQSTVEETIYSKSMDRVEEFLSRCLPSNCRCDRKLGTGNPAEAILKAAEEEGADLIVMGTHGHSGYERFFVGSVTNKVLHKASVPVLVVCKPSQHFIRSQENRPVQIDRILCALDFEPNNTRIAQTALSLARTYQSEIFFLHVFSNQASSDCQEIDRAIEKLKELVKPEEENWCKAQFLLKQGNITENILATLKEKNINLLVMGHHTRKPMEEYFLGSVAKQVVTESSCPVLVARSKLDDVYKNIDRCFSK
jgi:nucleotide-binding universal stress UspA family protein